MYIYYFLVFLIIIALQIETQTNSSRVLRIIFIAIFFLFAFRSYDVGIDTQRYIDEYVLGESFLRGTDYGYAAYASFLGSMGFSSRWFLSISSFIMLFPFFLYINRMGVPRLFSVLLYVTIGTFSMQLTGLRQSMAVSIMLLGVMLSMDIKKILLKELVLVGFILLAQSFHHSAIIGLLFVPIVYFMEKRVRVRGFGRMVLAILPIFLFFTSNIFAPIVNQFTIDRYESYEIGSEGINIIAFFVIPYIIFLYVLWLSGRVGLSDRYERFGFMCAILYIICASASIYMPILARFGDYFSLPLLVLITQLTNKTSKEWRKPLYVAIGVVCVLYFFISVSGGVLRIDNYHFSLQ